MTFTKKFFIYLGFCPSKESAKHFRLKSNSFTKNVRKWKPKGVVMFIGVLLIFTGLIPFYVEDSSFAGVTDTIIFHGKLGLTSFILGAILVILGAVIPKIIIKLGIEGV